ncbi:hypothetical protein WDW37_11255 [Bdellovibrionota bacterium FG-1]
MDDMFGKVSKRDISSTLYPKISFFYIILRYSHFMNFHLRAAQSTFVFFFMTLVSSSAWAGSSTQLCFDFSKPILSPLQPPIPYPSGSTSFPDTLQSGKHTDRGVWASARAQVKAPLSKVLEILRDPTTLKNPKDCDLHIEHLSRDALIDFETVDVVAHPMPLVRIKWREEWMFALAEGTLSAPKKVVFSYQKVAGTEHIKRFCGSIVLTAVNPTQTDLAIYEEIDATRRSANDVAKGHEGTLRTIRERLK